MKIRRAVASFTIWHFVKGVIRWTHMNKTFTISFNSDLAKVVEKEKRRGKFENTSEFFRHLVRSQYILNVHDIEVLDATDPVAKASKRSARTEQFVPFSQVRRELSL